MPQLHQLAMEIIADIVAKLPVQDVRNLASSAPLGAAGDKLRDACTFRLSITRYLLLSFGHGARLLDAMSRHCVYISGSRSLEFFVPGTIDQDSDFDFYVPRNKAVMESFMLELSAMGVIWTSSLDRLRVAVREGEGEVCFAWEQYRYHFRLGHFRDLAREFDLPNFTKPHLERSNYWAGRYVVVTVSDEGLSHNDDVWSIQDRHGVGDEDDAIKYARFGSVLNGFLIRPGSKIRVQLIVEPRANEMATPAVMHYHSSCVQSVIGPHMACHLYGNLALSYKSYAWRLDEPNIEAAHNKYKARGFEYVERQPKSFRPRVGEDCDSILVSRDSSTDAPPAVVELYEEYMKKMAWHEFTNHVTSLPSAVPHYMPSDPAFTSNWVGDIDSRRVRRALVELGALPFLDFIFSGRGGGSTLFSNIT
ncbi:hypothetical protein KCV07_g3765, partial [Aureobasidium melanogenum]